MTDPTQNAGAFDQSLQREIVDSGLVAVVTIDRLQDAVPLSQTLLDGGVRVLELTLRTPVALEAIRRIRERTPRMIVGAGTVLTPGQVVRARDAGASFGVAPGFNPRVVAAAKKAALPFAPGICTPSDIESAIEWECRFLKFFPAEPIGGIAYLKSINAPFAQFGLRFLPLGGISPQNMQAYLSEPMVAAVGGSWLAPRKLIADGNLQEIHAAALQATQQAQALREGRHS